MRLVNQDLQKIPTLDLSLNTDLNLFNSSSRSDELNLDIENLEIPIKK